MAIFKIFLTFSAVSTFVLRSSANILDSAQRKRFLSLSPLKNWSNYSCIESEIDDKRSKTPSVESWSLPLSLARCVLTPCLFPRKLTRCRPPTQPVTAARNRTNFPPIFEIFFFFFCVKRRVSLCSKPHFFFFFVIRKKLLKVSSLATLVVLVHLSSSRRICSGNLPVSSV